MSIFSRAFTGLTNILSSGVRMSASPRLLGRYTAGAGAGQEIQLGAGLSFVGDTLTYTSPGGGATWGAITGSLGSQTDLVAALDAKAAASHVHTTGDLTTSNGSTDAAVGKLGEYFESGPGSLTALTSDEYSNRGFINLTPGDWDVSGVVLFGLSSATGGLIGASFSTVSGTPSGDGIGYVSFLPFTALSGISVNAIPTKRVKVTTDTTVYLVAAANFSSGSVTATGQITARRIR